jgi:hypothetical protein
MPWVTRSSIPSISSSRPVQGNSGLLIRAATRPCRPIQQSSAADSGGCLSLMPAASMPRSCSTRRAKALGGIDVLGLVAAFLDRLGRVARHEGEPVFARVLEAEIDVGPAALPQLLDRLQPFMLDAAHLGDQEAEGLVAERHHDGVLVGEIEVERGRRNAHPVGDLADRRGGKALLEKQLLGGREDLVAAGMTLAPALPASRC